MHNKAIETVPVSPFAVQEMREILERFARLSHERVHYMPLRIGCSSMNCTLVCVMIAALLMQSAQSAILDDKLSPLEDKKFADDGHAVAYVHEQTDKLVADRLWQSQCYAPSCILNEDIPYLPIRDTPTIVCTAALLDKQYSMRKQEYIRVLKRLKNLDLCLILLNHVKMDRLF